MNGESQQKDKMALVAAFCACLLIMAILFASMITVRNRAQERVALDKLSQCCESTLPLFGN